MQPDDCLFLLAERRIFLSEDGGTLKYRAPEGAVDERVRELLRAHKESLVRILRERSGYQLLCPLSYNQQSLFFLYLLEPDSAAYNLALSMTLTPAADAAVLQGALLWLVRRHEQLRTTYGYAALGGIPHQVQFVHAELPPHFEAVDARDWTEAELAVRARKFHLTPLDLERGPIVRARLFTRGREGAVLVVVIPHIAADGWSMNRIQRDLAAAYREISISGSCDWEVVGAPYTEFALEQRRMLSEEVGAGHLRYWITALTPPPPPLDLSGEKRRPAVRSSVGATHAFHLEPSTRTGVERLARELGITSFALLLSVFQWLLFTRSRSRDVVVGVPTMGHKELRFDQTVGYFVNPVPLRCRRTGSISFREHAQTTARDLSEALDHRDAPFAAIVESLGGARDPARTPVFQVLFNLLSRKTLGDVIDLLYPVAATTPVDFGGLRAAPFVLDQQEGQVDLIMELVDRGGDILGMLRYCTDLFTAAEVVGLAKEYCERLESIMADPGRSLSEEVAARRVETALPFDGKATAGDRVSDERRRGSGARSTAEAARLPARELECVLAEAWKRALGLAEVSTTANIFELGGTSLLMVRVSTELQSSHNLDVPVTNMFEYPTIAGLARHLSRVGSAAGELSQAERAAARQREALQARKNAGPPQRPRTS